MLAYIEREQLLPAGCHVVVGVSGGPDSLCLLHLLWTLRDKLAINVHAAHLNHLIRGAEADADAQSVADLAARWGIPCTVAARNVPAIARQHKLAIEEAARRARYRFLGEIARREGATHVAVGHNANDQSETVLMHWLRGAGLAGLRGMLPATRLSDLRLLQDESPDQGADRSEIWLIRPLLETSRSDIERYCDEHGLAPRFDRSNLDTTLYRNKLRHDLLPLLEREYKAHFGEILRRSARVIRDDYDLLCTLRDRAWEQVVRRPSSTAVIMDRVAWQTLHPSLQRGILRRAVVHLRSTLRDVNFAHIEAAMRVAQSGLVGAQATLPRGLALTVGYSTLTIAGHEYTPEPDFPALPPSPPGLHERTPLIVPGATSLPGQSTIEISLLPREALPAGWEHNADPWCAYLDAEALGSSTDQTLFVRRRQPGDRFCPLGLSGRHKLVSDLLVNRKVPAHWRDRIPLLVRADDTILWVCGWQIDERARIHDRTTCIAVVRLRENRNVPEAHLRREECPTIQ